MKLGVVFLRFGVVIYIYIFFFRLLFWLLSITLGVSRVTIRDMGVWHKYKCMQFHNVFCRWVNDETCLNVKSSRVLEKGTFECRNVGFS